MDPIIERRRQDRQRQDFMLLALVAAAILFLILAVAGGVGLVALRRAERVKAVEAARREADAAQLAITAPVAVRPPAAGVSADREGVKWNHRELFDHLVGSGVAIDFGPASKWGGVWFVDRNAEAVTNHHDIAVSQRAVSVGLHRTPQEAHDAAGAAGERGWSWGRFSFRAAPHDSGPLLAGIKTALR